MAFAAVNAPVGFDLHRYVAENEIIWVPGDPGDVVDPGDLVTFTVGEGIADLAAADEAPFGIVAGHASITVTSATGAGFPRLGPKNISTGFGSLPSDLTRTMIPIIPLIPAGTPVLIAPFATNEDDVVAAQSQSTPDITNTVAFGGNDYPNGGLLYVYSGTGAGQWNVVADYVDATPQIVLHRKFETALSTDSNFIIMSGANSSNLGIGFFGRCTSDHDNLTCDNGANDGVFTVLLDGRQVEEFMVRGCLPVIPSALLLFA